jgi:hypothetical protein
MHPDWRNEIEDILDENVCDKISKIRKEVYKEMGAIGLLIHTRLNRLCGNNE